MTFLSKVLTFFCIPSLMLIMFKLTKFLTCLFSLTITTVTIAFDERATSSDNLTVTNSVHPPNNNEHPLLLCSDSNFRHRHIDCSQSVPLLTSGYCATYYEDRRILSLFWCPNIQPNATINGYTKLPRNLSQLNNYTCGQINRKGFLCSECADGFGLSVTSLGYKCVDCTDTWYGVPLFLFLEFVPITVLYFIVLVFQIRITSAPIPCFIMYAQIVVIGLNLPATHLFLTFTDSWQLKLPVDVKVMLMLYGLFNLDFCRNNLLPPYCVSSKIRPLHIALLGYISVFYPILLIFLTWVCVELHGRNFRPLVWLWRPFHGCFVRLQRGWDTKSDIIDVFITFFILSYNKLLFQSLMLVYTHPVVEIDPVGKPYVAYHSLFSPTILHGEMRYLALIIPSILVFFMFNFLPPLLLTFYPIRAFQLCLSKCRLNLIAINVFVEKIHVCYRNGLDGRRDMRSFSGLYFFLRMVAFLVMCLSRALGRHHVSQWYSVSILLLITTIAMALAKPYRKAYMNYLDILLLSIFTVLCFTASIRSEWHTIQVIARVLLATPLVVVVLFVVLRRCASFKHIVKNFRLRRVPVDIEPTQSSMVDTPRASRSMIQPTFTILGYGTMS